MAAYNNRYQYETSPRKLQPEYRPVKKRYPKKSTAKKKQVAIKDKSKNVKLRVVMYVVIGFAVLFGISYRNSQIGEEFSEIKSMKAELSSLEKENEQLKANIESSLNLGNIEKTASENLGMTKIDNGRTVYINMQKQDYVQSGSEEIIKNESSNWFKSIMDWFTSLIK